MNLKKIYFLIIREAVILMNKKLKLNRFVPFNLLFVLCLCSFLYSNNVVSDEINTCKSNYDIDVTLLEKNNHHKLNIKLTNRGLEDIFIHEAYLPWSTSSLSMVLIAVVDKPPYDNFLMSGGRTSNYYGYAKIKNDEMVSGVIDLSTKFRYLKETLKNEKVILFWNYKPKHKQNKKGKICDNKRKGGFVVIH